MMTLLAVVLFAILVWYFDGARFQTDMVRAWTYARSGFKRSRRGYTLWELIITIAFLCTLLIGVLFVVMVALALAKYLGS